MSDLPEMTPVADSSQVKAIGHHDGHLYVEFHARGENAPRSIYRYKDAPANHATDIHAAESKGRYFNQHIRGKFPHEKLSMDAGS